MNTKTITLHATTREVTGKKVKRLRQRGLLPAIIYGHGREPRPITLNTREFSKVYDEAGTSTLVDLVIDENKPIKVLLHEPQTHYLTGESVHADLYAVKMTEKIETAVPLEFVGVSKAVEEQEGNFITNKDEILIRCLPGDLISSIKVDISALETFDDQIRVKNLNVPENIEVIEDPEDVVALVTPPRSEEELEAELAEDKAAEEAAVEELAKEEGEEPEEVASETKKSAEELASSSDNTETV